MSSPSSAPAGDHVASTAPFSRVGSQWNRRSRTGLRLRIVLPVQRSRQSGTVRCRSTAFSSPSRLSAGSSNGTAFRASKGCRLLIAAFAYGLTPRILKTPLPMAGSPRVVSSSYFDSSSKIGKPVWPSGPPFSMQVRS